MRFELKFTFLIVVILLLSEFVYVIFNNTAVLVNTSLKLSKINPIFLEKAFQIRMSANAKKYSNYAYSELDFKVNSDQYKTYQKDEKKYLESELPLIAYNLGMYNSSILLDPDLSFPYVELSNFYYLQGDVDRGREVVNRCLQRIYPRKHCGDFVQNNINLDNFEQVGFQTVSINNYFANLRR